MLILKIKFSCLTAATWSIKKTIATKQQEASWWGGYLFRHFYVSSCYWQTIYELVLSTFMLLPPLWFTLSFEIDFIPWLFLVLQHLLELTSQEQQLHQLQYSDALNALRNGRRYSLYNRVSSGVELWVNYFIQLFVF